MTAIFFLVAWLRSRRSDGGALRQTAKRQRHVIRTAPLSPTVSPTDAPSAERTQP